MSKPGSLDKAIHLYIRVTCLLHRHIVRLQSELNTVKITRLALRPIMGLQNTSHTTLLSAACAHVDIYNDLNPWVRESGFMGGQSLQLIGWLNN